MFSPLHVDFSDRIAGCTELLASRERYLNSHSVRAFCAAEKATTVGYGRHLLASAPAPSSVFLTIANKSSLVH